MELHPIYKNFTLLNGELETFKEDPKFIFVLMPFGKNKKEKELFNNIFSKIKNTVEKIAFRGGLLKCSRADIEKGFNILEDIFKNIKKAGVTIFDISFPNLNVYYELGIACALDKKILLLFNRDYYYAKNSGETLPFDIKQFRYIEYQNLNDLELKLRKIIELTVNITDYSKVDLVKIYKKLQKITRHLKLDSKAEQIREDYEISDSEISKTFDVLDKYWNDPELEKKNYKGIKYMDVEYEIRSKTGIEDWQRVKMILRHIYWSGHYETLIGNLENLPAEFDDIKRDFKVKNEIYNQGAKNERK